MHKITLFACLLFFFHLTTTSVQAQTAKKPKYSQEAINYFLEVALGSEYGNSDKVIVKWHSEIRLYVAGEPTPGLKQEIDKIVKELNGLIKTIQIREVLQESQANLVLFLGAKHSYAKNHEPKVALYNDLGFFYVYPNSDKIIQKGSLYIDTARMTANDTRFHFLREELTQCLGLMNDSERYPESMFYQKWSLRNEFTPLDKQLIEMLYLPQLKAGIDAKQAKQILESIER